MKMKVVWTLVLFSFLLPQIVFSADPALNKDQFKAPSVSDASKTPPKPGAPVPVPGSPVKPAGIQGLQSDALLAAYLAAPAQFPATSRGTNARGHEDYICPRGYYCPGGDDSLPAVCVKDRRLWDNEERGTCTRGAGFLYGGWERVEKAPAGT